jgi:hypothetical protein
MPVLEKDFLTLENAPGAARLSWSAVRSALVADALRGRGHLRLRVHGESMLPTLWPGDVVEIEGCSLEDIRPGEIVLARREERLFLHRLVAPCTPNGFLLRGDSVPRSDLFPSEALLGRLVRRIECLTPEGASDFGEVSVSLKRYPDTNRIFPVDCAAALGLGYGAEWFGVKWSRVVGMLLCHCGVARRLALRLHRRGNSSARAFRNPEHGTDVNSAELGA